MSSPVQSGAHFAANRIDPQMAAAGWGSAAIPSLAGVLADRASLAMIPVLVAAAFAGRFGL